MKKCVAIFIIFLISNVYAEYSKIEWKICPRKKACISWNEIKQNYLNRFKHSTTKRLRLYAKIPCNKSNAHVGIYIPQVNDAFSLKLNGKYLQHWNNLDISSESNLIQIPTYLCKRKNYLEMDVYNLNNSVIGIDGETLYGNYRQLFWKSKINYLLKSGHSIISSYMMFFFGMLTLCFYFYRKHTRLLSLFLYSMTSSTYLLISSGVFNFFIENKSLVSSVEWFAFLLQNISLLYLLRVYFSWPGKKDNLYISLISFHIMTLLYHLVVASFDSHYVGVQEMVMFTSSLLIISTSIYALHVIIGSKERCSSLECVLTWVFAFSQINDLLVMWNVYYFILLTKIIIPICAVILLVVHFKKLANLVKQKEVLSMHNENNVGLFHDIKIPLDVIDVLYRNDSRSESELKLFNFSMTRIQKIISNYLKMSYEPVTLNVVDLSLCTIEEQMKLNNISSSSIKINFPIKGLINSLDDFAHRVVSNVVKNAFDATALGDNPNGIIEFSIVDEGKYFIFNIYNKGKRIQYQNVESAIDGSRSKEFNGYGIGLQQIYKLCKQLGWEFTIFPYKEGTVTKLSIKKDI